MSGTLKKLTPEQAEAAVHLYESGMSCAPIAKRYGVSRQAMHDLLKRRTQMRPRERYGRDNHFYRGGDLADGWAHNLVETALSQGVLVRPDACEECGCAGEFADGRTAIQAHHDDYNKPLDVRWLCQRCHHAWHKHNTAIPKRKLMTIHDDTTCTVPVTCVA